MPSLVCATDVAGPVVWPGLIRAATAGTDKPSRCEGLSVAQPDWRRLSETPALHFRREIG
ncbi:MAG: hypothetical protein ABSE73_21940 [Planctomycetota bacterium]